MQNEWDMFAYVRKQLDGGAALVTVYLTSLIADVPAGQLGEAMAETGETYELGTEFIAAFQACIREAKIPWHYSPTGRRWDFGPGVVDAPARITLPGALSLDLTNEHIELFFGPEDDAETTRWTS
jgi:hypothetical protein